MRHPATLDTGLAPESTTPNNAAISTGYVIDRNKGVSSCARRPQLETGRARLALSLTRPAKTILLFSCPEMISKSLTPHRLLRTDGPAEAPLKLPPPRLPKLSASQTDKAIAIESMTGEERPSLASSVAWRRRLTLR